jgi:hypothetical protein
VELRPPARQLRARRLQGSVLGTLRANSRIEQFKALGYDALRDARCKFRLCPECSQPFVPVRRQAYCSAGCSAGRPHPQVAQGASREEPRDPPSAVPKVKGSRVKTIQARGDQDCATTPTITEVVSRRLRRRTQTWRGASSSWSSNPPAPGNFVRSRGPASVELLRPIRPKASRAILPAEGSQSRR